MVLADKVEIQHEECLVHGHAQKLRGKKVNMEVRIAFTAIIDGVEYEFNDCVNVKVSPKKQK